MTNDTPNENPDGDNAHIEAVREATSFGSSEPTDGRNKYEWSSRYPADALRVIRCEALILAVVFIGSLALLFLTWCGVLDSIIAYCCNTSASTVFQKYCYFSFSGLLAGATFSMKYLYHAVARGLWHLDRQLWRFLSPLISMGVAFIVGTLIHANMLGSTTPTPIVSSPAAISIGFIAGYFSDSAIAKMYEIANVIFGTSNRSSNSK